MIDRTAARVHMRAMRKAHVAAFGQEARRAVGSYHAVRSAVDPALLEAILRLRGQIIALPMT
jgi:hypothetical protein